MLIWHWSQPLSYLAVFGAYYCSLDTTQRVCGMIVAAREVVYLVETLLALRQNPAYLMLELRCSQVDVAWRWSDGCSTS